MNPIVAHRSDRSFMSPSPWFMAILQVAYHYFQINPYQNKPSIDLQQPSSWVFPAMPVLFAPRSAAQLSWRKEGRTNGLRPRLGILSLANYSRRQKIETCFGIVPLWGLLYVIWFNHARRTSTINITRPTVINKKVDQTDQQRHFCNQHGYCI